MSAIHNDILSNYGAGRLIGELATLGLIISRLIRELVTLGLIIRVRYPLSQSVGARLT